ncbi:MAG: response regulator [Anaerolineales bacterium]|nr:response regulator [Chloroflexota bacterium]MBL6982414.1 response regulator [Anaerolineales bacterium]
MEINIAKHTNFLYVDDNDKSRLVMQLLMEKAMDAQFLTIFEDSADFMERVTALSPPPDVALLDINVQPHDGFEMLEMLRKNPQLNHTKIIAVTASVTNEEIEKLRDCGFDGGIGKPLRVTTFPSLINQILNGETVWHVV